MLTRIGQILVVSILIVANCGCGVKKHKELEQRPSVISEKVEAGNKEEKMEMPSTADIADEDKIARQDFYRIILESHDDKEIYHLLKEVASFLRDDDGTIVLVDKALQTLESSEETLRKIKRDLGETIEPNFALIEAEALQVKSKKYQAELAIVYNKKMAATKFKFAEVAGLPEGQTETLPRVFPIR